MVVGNFTKQEVDMLFDKFLATQTPFLNVVAQQQAAQAHVQAQQMQVASMPAPTTPELLPSDVASATDSGTEAPSDATPVVGPQPSPIDAASKRKRKSSANGTRKRPRTEAERKERRRMQNRVAAATSRQKKKRYHADLENKVNELTTTTQKLQAQLAALMEENTRLRSLTASQDPQGTTAPFSVKVEPTQQVKLESGEDPFLNTTINSVTVESAEFPVSQQSNAVMSTMVLFQIQFLLQFMLLPWIGLFLAEMAISGPGTMKTQFKTSMMRCPNSTTPYVSKKSISCPWTNSASCSQAIMRSLSSKWRPKTAGSGTLLSQLRLSSPPLPS